MAAPSWDVRIDWNSDGSFTGTGDDVTTRALARTELAIEYGRDQVRSLSPMAPGRAELELNNVSRDYSPENSSSPLADNLGPGRAVRVQATHLATTYTVYRGYLDDYEVHPELERRSVSFTTLDGLARLKGVKVSTALHQGIQTGDAVGVLLDEIGWTAGRDIDTGASTLRWWWEEDADAFEALERIVTAEGPPAFVHMGADGEFVFRGRHHRLTRTASTTVQATFRDTGTEPVFSGLSYDAGWRDIVNSVEFEVVEREIRSTPDVIWQMYSQYQLSPGETLTFRLVGNSNLFTNVISPTQGTDPAVDTDFVVSGTGTPVFTLDRTSGQSYRLEISLPLGGTAVTLTRGRLRGYVVDQVSRTKVLVEDSDSIRVYGRRTYPGSAPNLGVHDANAVAQLILGQRAQRLPVIQMRLVGSTDTRLTQQLSRDLSDRVRVIEPELGLDASFYIERIHHLVKEAGLVLETTFGLEKVRTLPANVFRFDTAGAGFNDGVFASTGLDDPTNAFRFDTSGQGFDQGLFAT